jgi:hypothetical protein
MINLYFFLVALIQLGIAVYGAGKLRRYFNWYALLVLIVVFALAYDNLAIAAGAVFEAGPLLKAINFPRYWMHAFFLPTTMIAAFGALRMSGVKVGRGKTWHGIVCTIATLLIGLGMYIDVFNLALEPETDGVMLRYVNTFEPLNGPPIPAVVTIIAVILIGAILWRHSRFAWLFLGGLVMFITAPLTNMLIAQNIGEIAFAGALVITMIRFNTQTQEAS